MTEDEFLGALVTYDFVTCFPHVDWISNWSGNKIERLRLDVAADAFDRTVRSLVAKLAVRFEIEFEEHDLSDVRTADEFEKRIEGLGWRDWKPPLNG